ncbi:MAG: HAMP domain-containing protein [Aquabacterium sp.]|jgi:methyl-accepting chemotaxis protein|nr:MAG: HAMP domain-containing protein [Aquabacterium sp.]
MKLRTKLLAAPLLTATVLLAALLVCLWVVSADRTRNEDQQQATLQAYSATAAAQAKLADSHTMAYRTVAIIASLDDKRIQAVRAQLKADVDAVSRDVKRLGEASAEGSKVRMATGRFESLVAKYQKSADAAIDMATVDANTGIASLQSADAEFRELAQAMSAVVTGLQDAAAEQSQQAKRRSQWLAAAITVVGVLSALGAIAFAWLTQRKVVSDIAQAARAASNVAAGDLRQRVDAQREDEIGELLRSLDAMMSGLTESIQTVQMASSSINTASSEIAAGNQDLSSRTEHTAGSLQQTASSMEQLTGTVKQTADSARTANSLASTAAAAATRGGEVVAQVVSSMESIHVASRKINDIIGVIDGIAFQTNILALNAAVEAARAGEQGRGFAVVAGEVRSLAQRSAQAAQEIKTLIHASTESVESGSKLVQDAGTTMQDIVDSVGRVSAIIEEITAATSDQSQGIGSVTAAVGELDRMTQQNAALVEQSAAAAESLKDQTARLSEVVARFRLAGGGH